MSDKRVLFRLLRFLAGFPCQPFSIQGKNLGIDDPAGRGTVIVGILKYVARCMPRIVLLENVAGLVNRHRSVLNNVLAALEGMTDRLGNVYTVSWNVLDSLQYGSVPCKRNRLYIVAVKGTSRTSDNVESLMASCFQTGCHVCDCVGRVLRLSARASHRRHASHRRR